MAIKVYRINIVQQLVIVSSFAIFSTSAMPQVFSGSDLSGVVQSLPLHLSKSQKFLVNVYRYHMGKNITILASIVALVPSCTVGWKALYAVAPLAVQATIASDNAPSETQVSLDLSLGDPAVQGSSSFQVSGSSISDASSLAEAMPLIVESTCIEDGQSSGRFAGFLSAGGATVGALVWYILSK